MGDKHYLIATFGSEHDVLEATKTAHQQGFSIQDVYTPFPVHGMDDAMGLKASRLPIICFVFAICGAIFAIIFQFWVSAVDWPINVGGRPWNSWPAFVPVAFEIMVLCAGLGTVAVLFLRCGLYPGKTPKLISPQVTDDRFVLVLEKNKPDFDMDRLNDICRRNNVISVEQKMEEL